eukprot:TRINITY_DN2018_c0_g2_i1.p3 TRINITY_DN2018_c0_g2~~TRINITY_DN2018_c0_g2_i1.p3  ORF type:complete len:159 (-),score=125.66 TRINITY_DN2018_c0_g2_i1:55-531(-)
MTHHGAFDATLAVARAYALDERGAWVRAIYQQAVVRGNLPFVSRMLMRGMRVRPLVADVIALYRADVGDAAVAAAASDATAASRRGNMQALLRASLDDAVALYDICVSLGMKEMAAYLRQSRALVFFRPESGAKSNADADADADADGDEVDGAAAVTV